MFILYGAKLSSWPLDRTHTTEKKLYFEGPYPIYLFSVLLKHAKQDTDVTTQTL